MSIDLLIRNARIWTGDPARPWATSLAVTGGRVAGVGTEDGTEPEGDVATVVDLDGAFVVPGLHDVHNHHAVAGRTDLFECRFLPTDSLEAALDAVAAYARDLPPDGWVVGGNWGSNLLDRLSTLEAREALDAAAGGRPAMLRDDSNHNRWVSSEALRLAGIDAGTPDPAGGQVHRDPATGEPTGVLIEAGGLLVEKALAATATGSLEDDARCSERGIEILHTHGITAFQDAATSLQVLRALKHLDDTGRLKAWVVSSMPVNDVIFGSDPVGEELFAHREEVRSPHHFPDSVKIFLDGVPTSRTAAFLEPYLPDDLHGECWRGGTTMPAEDLLDVLRRTAAQGLSAKIHCTGDASVRMTLDAIATVRAEGHTDVRYHIAHGQYVHEDDVPRLAELDVVADLSPTLWFPGVILDAIKKCVPAERAERMHPNRWLLEHGTVLAGGSDWPVSVTPDVWLGIQGLVTREDPSGEFPGTLWPEQALTLEEALTVYTSASARAMGLSEHTGSLELGKSADFVVLDRDPFRTDPHELATITAQQTWFAGELVHRRH
ncbi:amidohydrolase [Kineococcus esterisolvens]|uniref:amidohydrolase n=1 Tax=unclassified Kineococcus TaxID=2621656 RepID=UPI003D7C36F4